MLGLNKPHIFAHKLEVEDSTEWVQEHSSLDLKLDPAWDPFLRSSFSLSIWSSKWSILDESLKVEFSIFMLIDHPA
jgi:hypothetical protein